MIASGFWRALLGPVLASWVTPTVGVSLVPTVATESLAVLSATLAMYERTPWLLDAALAPFLLGIAVYVFVISRIALRQLTIGSGEHRIVGGAPAIAARGGADRSRWRPAPRVTEIRNAPPVISVVL